MFLEIYSDSTIISKYQELLKKIHEVIDASCKRGVACLRESLGYDNTLTEDEM